jgi:hypothetical protein
VDVASYVGRLYAAGARRFLVMGLPNLGRTLIEGGYLGTRDPAKVCSDVGNCMHCFVDDALVPGFAARRVEQRANIPSERFLREIVIGPRPDDEQRIPRTLHPAAREVAFDVVIDVAIDAAGQEELRALLDGADTLVMGTSSCGTATAPPKAWFWTAIPVLRPKRSAQLGPFEKRPIQ